MNDQQIKQIVKEKYGQIAKAKSSCCCESSASTACCDEQNYIDVSDSYAEQSGYYEEADLHLGCGVPTKHAAIKKGDVVLDLGSGAGNDVFIARRIVGAEGKVIGVDMTEEMNERARKNAAKLGYQNVEFKSGEIENLPVENKSVDVVISNCVLNLVPNKEKAFAEIFRVLKPGGHFCISDIVIKGEMPKQIQTAAEMYVGCIAGAIPLDEYMGIIEKTGFVHVDIKKNKLLDFPDEVLLNYISEDVIKEYRASGSSVNSITVYGERIA